MAYRERPLAPAWMRQPRTEKAWCARLGCPAKHTPNHEHRYWAMSL